MSPSTVEEIQNTYGRKKWKLLLSKLIELEEVVPDLIKECDREVWIVEALSKFLHISIKNNQDIPLDKKVKGDYLETSKLVRVNRLIPKVYLDVNSIDYVILGGLYVEMPTVIFTPEFSMKVEQNLIGINDNSKGELPVEYHYGTRKETDSGHLIALGYNNICPLYLRTSSDWTYFEI